MHNKTMTIEFVPGKSRANQKKHGVSFADAEQVLRDEMAVTMADSEGEQRFITLGLDSLGRVLVVVHTPRGENTRLISARKASPAEAEQYYA